MDMAKTLAQDFNRFVVEEGIVENRGRSAPYTSVWAGVTIRTHVAKRTAGRMNSSRRTEGTPRSWPRRGSSGGILTKDEVLQPLTSAVAEVHSTKALA